MLGFSIVDVEPCTIIHIAAKCELELVLERLINQVIQPTCILEEMILNQAFAWPLVVHGEVERSSSINPSIKDKHFSEQSSRV